MPSGKPQVDHIFDKSKTEPGKGHIAPTTEASKGRAGRLFESAAADPKNKRPDLVTDPNKQKAGIEIYTEEKRYGQVWVETCGSVIEDAGVNRNGYRG